MPPLPIAPHQGSGVREMEASSAAHDDSAVFSQSIRATDPKTTTELHGDALVRRTSPFQTLNDAARHALDGANPSSIASNQEVGGNLYQRESEAGQTFGY